MALRLRATRAPNKVRIGDQTSFSPEDFGGWRELFDGWSTIARYTSLKVSPYPSIFCSVRPISMAVGIPELSKYPPSAKRDLLPSLLRLYHPTGETKGNRALSPATVLNLTSKSLSSRTMFSWVGNTILKGLNAKRLPFSTTVVLSIKAGAIPSGCQCW